MSDHQTDTAKANILVVDDNPDNLHLLVGILAEQRHKVRPASSGRIALVTVQAELPDLILLDIMMPEMDGFAVCQQLKTDERTHDIPVIFISALDEMLDKVKAFSIGGVDYITKPFQAEEVLARVNTHLTIRYLQKHLQEQNVQLQERNSQLQEALDKVKLLSGLLPICANCKKIRDDEGYWQDVAVYIRDHSEAEFSHGICSDCIKELYPELYEKIDERRQNIVDVLKKLGQARLEEIAAAVNFPESNTLNRLQSMVKNGQVKCLEVEGENLYILS